MNQETQRIAVSGAAGHIGYALLFRIASGAIFGPNTDIELSLLELESAMPSLRGVEMELEDCAFPLLKSISVSSDPGKAFADADWALLVGAVPRKAGMERKDLLNINGKIFIGQGKAIDSFAKETCRVLVVGNPCNTNAYIAKSVSQKIPRKNFFAMTMLDQNRAASQIAKKAGVHAKEISNIAIWGNHSTTQYPDFYNATINGKPVIKIIEDEAWLKNDFLTTVQKRGAEIIKARGASSAASAANAIVDTVRLITTPTPKGKFFSLGVCSDGSYNTPEGLIVSFPVRSDGNEWEIVQGIKHDAFGLEKIDLSIKELLEEKEAVSQLTS